MVVGRSLQASSEDLVSGGLRVNLALHARYRGRGGREGSTPVEMSPNDALRNFMSRARLECQEINKELQHQDTSSRRIPPTMSLSQLSRLLPLPEADLQQVLDYAATLSKQEAADHFNNLLGESPQSIEFISSFNSRRQNPNSKPQASSSSQPSESSGVPKSTRKAPKKKAPLHALPARDHPGKDCPR